MSFMKQKAKVSSITRGHLKVPRDLLEPRPCSILSEEPIELSDINQSSVEKAQQENRLRVEKMLREKLVDSDVDEELLTEAVLN
jgi:hypothetical protein